MPKIVGTGCYLPRHIASSSYLAERFGVTAEWIGKRCGIQERRYAADTESTSDLAAKAVDAAINDARWSRADLQCLILCTLSPDHMFPGTGVYVQAKLGLGHIAALDIRNQCSGFLYGLVIANSLITSCAYDRVVVAGAEIHSRCLGYRSAPPEIAVLFGDGAAAVAVEKSSSPMLIAQALHSDGSGADCLKLELFNARGRPWISTEDILAKRHLPVMNGKRVFLRAVSEMASVATVLMRQADLNLEAIDLVIPHQANLRIIEALQKRLGIKEERMFKNIALRGNTTAASIPLAIHEARQSGRLRQGQTLMLLAFGSGFTWGGCILQY